MNTTDMLRNFRVRPHKVWESLWLPVSCWSRYERLPMRTHWRLVFYRALNRRPCSRITWESLSPSPSPAVEPVRCQDNAIEDPTLRETSLRLCRSLVATGSKTLILLSRRWPTMGLKSSVGSAVKFAMMTAWFDLENLRVWWIAQAALDNPRAGGAEYEWNINSLSLFFFFFFFFFFCGTVLGGHFR